MYENMMRDHDAVDRTTAKTLSVVIPAYNVERYIEKCLESVLSQANARHNIEIIVIIDGATDGTKSVIEATIARYPNTHVTVVTKKNTGLSGARNTGLNFVKTKYVTFLDSDDYWLPGFLDITLDILTRSCPDMLEYDAILTNETGEHTSVLKISCGPDNRAADTDRWSFLNVFRCYAWARIYRTDLFKTYLFPVGRKFEDTSTIPWLYWNCENIVSLGIPLIGYRQRAGSILRRPQLSDIEDLNLAARNALSMYRTHMDEYWFHVTMRIFQQSCSRITSLPFRQWSEAARLAANDVSTGLRSDGNLVRWIQIRYTRLYVALLYVKRMTLDRLKLYRMRSKFAKDRAHLSVLP